MCEISGQKILSVQSSYFSLFTIFSPRPHLMI